MKDIRSSWQGGVDDARRLTRRTKRGWLVTLFSVLVLSITAALPNAVLAEADPVKVPVKVTFTGYAVQSIYGTFMEALMIALREEYPTWTVTSKPSNPAGGLGLVAANEADIGIASTVEARLAALGQDPFATPLRDKLAWLCYANDDMLFYFLADKSWAKANNIVSMADIAKVKPKMRISINRKGNQLTVAPVLQLLALHGVSERDIESWGGTINWVTATDGLGLMQDGKIDVYASVGFRHSSSLADIAKKRPLQWLAPNPDYLNATAKEWSFEIDSVRADNYSFPDTFAVKDLPTLNAGLAILVRKDMDPLVVEQILAAWLKHGDRVEALGPGFANFRKILGTIPGGFDIIPMHVGAKKFFKNVGTR